VARRSVGTRLRPVPANRAATGGRRQQVPARFRLVADGGQGWDYPYAGWYQRLLGLAEAGWFPVVFQEYCEVSMISYPFGQKTHLTAFSCGLLMIITQEPAQSLAALDAPLTIEVTVSRK
jgi:hypothetical protein